MAGWIHIWNSANHHRLREVWIKSSTQKFTFKRRDMILVSSQGFWEKRTKKNPVVVFKKKNSTWSTEKNTPNRGVNVPHLGFGRQRSRKNGNAHPVAAEISPGLTATMQWPRLAGKTHTVDTWTLPLFGVPNDDSVSGVSIHYPSGSEWHPNWKVLVSIIVFIKQN